VSSPLSAGSNDRRVEDDRLAVDGRADPFAARIDPELRAGPPLPGRRQPAGRGPEEEVAPVEPFACADREERELVAVVPDEDDARPHRLAVDGRVQRVVVAGDGGERLQPGERLAAPSPSLAAVDEPGVDPERDVVEEEAFAHAAHVDAPLDAVDEGGEGGDRVGPVEPDVPGEVVAGPERDADEAGSGLDRRPRDRGE
jgi:hypothetical protein